LSERIAVKYSKENFSKLSVEKAEVNYISM